MKQTVRKPIVPPVFFRLAEAVEKNTTYRVILASPSHPALRLAGRDGAINSDCIPWQKLPGRSIIIANNPRAVFALAHEAAHTLFSYSLYSLPPRAEVEEWVCNQAAYRIAAAVGAPAPAEHVYDKCNIFAVREAAEEAAEEIAQEILSWL